MHDETGYIECHERVGNKLIAVSDYSDQFSSILGPQASQHDVFNTCGIQLLETALEGKDVCLFAYGQTGSGKTFSMYGAEGGKNPAKLDGVVPAMCAELFRRKQQMEKRHDVKLSLDASLVEVQGNKVIDLLADSMPDGQQPALRLRGAEVQGEQRVKVHSSRWLTHLIERGMSKRVTTQNMTHAHSSRSHAFLTLIIEKRVHAHGEVAQIHKSTVYLVDLAGSERFVSGSQTSVGGGSINAGLLSLGKVLMALSQHSPHVPYRDSVLTRMLSNILGNDCLTYVLACVNPGFEQFSETRNVLQYAQRATAVMPKLGAEPHKSDSDSGYDTDGAAAHDDPMAHDSFDVDESMDRRTEMIETVSFGDVFARCVGDPGNPLLLYVHGSGKGKRASSKMWNSLVTNVSRKMAEEAAAHAAASASKARGKKREEQEPGSFKQKGKGKDGKDKRRSASDLKDDGADADEEDEAASSGYSLVYNLRSRLSLAIRGRKKELMQMSCSMCFSPLISPARIVSCRHVLCEVCVEKTIFYFRDCPICERAMSDAAPIDVDHAEVMRVRLSSLSQPPPIVTTQKARLDSMTRERERSNRAVLEFGSEGRALGGGKTEFTFFLRVVRSPVGAQVFRGAHCPISLDAYELIDHVTLHCGAAKAEPAEGESGYQHARAHDYSVTTTARRCRITIHWSAAFRMAPLQVRYTASGAALFQRRIVVQLPPDVTSSSTKAIEHDDGGAPLVFGDDAGVSSGWVTYLPGLSGGRAQGTIHLSSRKVKEAMAALVSSGLAWKWAERLAEETEEAVDEAIGQVRDVQHELVCGATKLTPLRELGKGAASDGSRKSKDLLLKSICNGMDPAIVETYETMVSMMHASSKSGGLSELFNEQTRAAAHPKNFYQVAIDLPGYGKTPPMSGGFCSPKFLSEVVRALAKLHAFAIVACGQAASSLLKAVVEIPKLTSFIIVREPLIENIDLETLHGILHPTLAVCDMHSRLYPSVRQLSSVLPQITSPKFALSTNPNFYQKEMASEMYKFMLDNGWHGSLPSTGNSMKLPLLTRLAGGIGAWKGDGQNEKATAPATATPTDPAATRSTPRKDHSSSTPSMPPAQPTSRSSVDKEPLPSTRRNERPSRSTSERPARSTSAADKDPLPSTRRHAERPSRSTSERPTRSIFGQHKTRGGITPRASADKGRRPSFSVPSTPTAESKAQWEAERPPLPSVSVPSTPKLSTSQKTDNNVVPSTPKGSGTEVPVSARPSRSILDRLSAPKLRGGAAKSGNRP